MQPSGADGIRPFCFSPKLAPGPPTTPRDLERRLLHWMWGCVGQIYSGSVARIKIARHWISAAGQLIMRINRLRSLLLLFPPSPLSPELTQPLPDPQQHVPVYSPDTSMILAKSIPVTKLTAVHADAINGVDNAWRECKSNATMTLSMELIQHLPKQQHWAIQAPTSPRTISTLLPWMMQLRAAQPHRRQDHNRATFTDGLWSHSAKATANSASTRVSVSGSVIAAANQDCALLSPAVASLAEHQQRQAPPPPHSFVAANDTASSSSMIQSDDPVRPSAPSSADIVPHDTCSVLSSGHSSTRSTTRNNYVLPALAPTPCMLSTPNNDKAAALSGSFFQSLTSLFTRKTDQPPQHPIWIQHLHARLSTLVEELRLGHQNRTHRRIAIVGIHGWFPTKLVRSMIGEPTGTSQKFCTQMLIALRQYFLTEHQLVLPGNAITLIPLEGEGKVEERVGKLYNQLVQNATWLEAISSAHVILWGTHSQGTPVSVMLLHQLLERQHIGTQHTSICMLAMAGIGHGPFAALQGSLIVKYVEADAARELFEFMDSSSGISQRFRHALAAILRKDVKLVLVASLQDQVVPLYSAMFTSISHPNILRAVYIDKHIYAENDFLIDLVVFALRLRNAGLSDHGLLIHVSEVLAGSIYALEGGHSTIYEAVDVYLTAVRYLFHGSSDPCLSRQSSPQEPCMEPFKASARPNPFYLPWAVRAIFDDSAILQEAPIALQRLLELFRAWAPTSARLREIKFRLEPLSDHSLP